MEGKKKTASGTEKEAALAELDRVERELAELGPDPALEADKKSNAVLDKGKTRPLKEVKYPVAVSASELKKMEIPQIVWIVDRLLPVGVSMIGAPSKYFKSYMALGLCLAVCTGEKFLSFQCNKYACLYLDLESTKRRPKSRLKQIIPNGDWPENFYILTAEDEVSKINEGFTEQIEHQLNQHPDIKLIIVDVFQMIRQPAKRNQSGYDRDYDDFKVLKRIADSHEIALLLIHHTRKMKDPGDVFNELSGSVGVMGALDCAWIITKEDRYSDEGTLNVTGRDMESQKLKIRFNKCTFQWEYVGTEEDVNKQRRIAWFAQNPIRETIQKLVQQGNGYWEGTADDIKTASKYLSWEINEDVRKIGKFIREFDDLFQGIDGINAVPGNSKTRRWKFNATDDTNNTNNTNATTLCDVVACPDCSENEILDKIQAEQLKTVIWTIVDDLPGIAPEVLRARFQEDLTLKETAARVGTTVEAVRQWQSKGLRELRKPSMSNELKPFIWDDYVYNQALRGNGAEHFNRTWTSSTERIALEEW